MPKCWRCGKKGFFLRLTSDGLCQKCQEEHNAIINLDKKALSTIYKQGSFQITHNLSSHYVEIRQKTPGELLPFSVDAWAGYVSPSGGFVNYARYQITGINPKTNRKNTRTVEEFGEKYVIRRAELYGLVAPFKICILPSLPPSERQLSYAHDLGITIPEGACKVDVSALISRVTDDDEAPADENIASQAHIYGVKFSRYHGKKAILELAKSLPADDYRDFKRSI